MIARRLVRLADRMAAVRVPTGGIRDAWRDTVTAFLERIPPAQRPAVAAALADPARAEYLAEWVSFPVARGAVVPDGFPTALVEVMLADPAAEVLHDCEQCGLGIPIRAGGTATSITLFPACTGCGGRTGFLAYRGQTAATGCGAGS